MKEYYRIMLGQKSMYAEECFKGNFIGAGFIRSMDLTDKLPDNWREFNKEFIPLYLKENPEKSRITAGLACGALWTISKGLQTGDIVFCPTGAGSYKVGRVSGAYSYHNESNLPHQRAVEWFPNVVERTAMSETLQNSTGSIGTVCLITKHEKELESLLAGNRPPDIISTDETIENPSEFAIEKHLEDFLVKNWAQVDLGRNYDIFSEEGELVGQQYNTDTGPIDILAVSKDRKELLVVELKKGRASDNVVGQIQRYMGYVKEELAEPEQTVKGVIIALEDDLRIRRALMVAPNIEFYRYQINFKLTKS